MGEIKELDNPITHTKKE